MIAITGAAGKLGRCVAKALLGVTSPSEVTLGTRNPGGIQELAEHGFRTVLADFDRRETLEAAFAGADVAFIICGDAPNHVRVVQHRNAIDAARKAGVRRVVYTSFVNPHGQSRFPFALVHEDSETYLRESGLAYTLLRNNHYAENLGYPLMEALRTGTLSMLGAGGKVAYIGRADVAVATAGALTQPGHENRSYELTGSEALDLFEVAEIASRTWGRRISAKDMSPAEYREMLQARGLPAYLVEAQVGIRLAAEAGEYSTVSSDAERLAGRPADTMAVYLRSLPRT